jgi:hypothetical protein
LKIDSDLEAFGIILAAGLIGGILNVLVSGFEWPSMQPATPPAQKKYSFGSWAELLGGVVAAIVWWLMNSGLKDYVILPPSQTVVPCLVNGAYVAQSVIIAFGGSRWLKTELDKLSLNQSVKTLSLAASTAALGKSNSEIARQMRNVPPNEVLDLAQQLLEDKSE